jgi:hypothetical protein
LPAAAAGKLLLEPFSFFLHDRLIPRGNQQGYGYFEFFAVLRAFDQHVVGSSERLAVNPVIIHLPLPALGFDSDGKCGAAPKLALVLSANFGGLLRPVHPHLFRHQMITYLTWDLSHTQIQPDLCHESKKSLEIYQHLSLDAVEQAYEEAVQGVSI